MNKLAPISHRLYRHPPSPPASALGRAFSNSSQLGLEKVAAMVNHGLTRTTQLCDRRRDQLTLDEVERIVI
jgi:hypothetical protein